MLLLRADPVRERTLGQLLLAGCVAQGKALRVERVAARVAARDELLDHVVDGDVGRRHDQHPLAPREGPADDARNDRRLPRARRALDHGEVWRAHRVLHARPLVLVEALARVGHVGLRRRRLDVEPRRGAGAEEGAQGAHRAVVARRLDEGEGVELALKLDEVRHDRDVADVRTRRRRRGESQRHHPHAPPHVLRVERDQLRALGARQERQKLARRVLQELALRLGQEGDRALDGARGGLEDLLLAAAPGVVVVEGDADRAGAVFGVFDPHRVPLRLQGLRGRDQRLEGHGRVVLLLLLLRRLGHADDLGDDRAREEALELRHETGAQGGFEAVRG